MLFLKKRLLLITLKSKVVLRCTQKYFYYVCNVIFKKVSKIRSKNIFKPIKNLINTVLKTLNSFKPCFATGFKTGYATGFKQVLLTENRFQTGFEN